MNRSGILKNQDGFTLIEIILVMALLLIVSGTIAPLAWSFAMQNDLDVATGILAQSLRRAQVLAISMKQDSSWGVEVDSQKITLFSGSNFFGRNADFDETFDIPVSLNVTGPSQIIFNKFSGQPNTAAVINLSDTLNQSRTVTVNSAGMVDY